MKPSEFKTLIKEAVREAFQEELKEILLEAVKAPKGVPVGVGGYSTVTESQGTYAQPNIENPKQLNTAERRNMFAGMIGEMQQGGIANTTYQGTINPSQTVDTINGALPQGEVGLDMIMGLMKK
tara:strand:+ start:1657 stop:2028 length:372 start_codon:yes stop_codon:yes gene_type:complete